MADISIQDIAKEVGKYVVNNKSVIGAGVYSDVVQINQYCKTLTAINGQYPQFHNIMSRVVQGFAPVWQALGTESFKSKKLENFRQKVNFPVVPAQILPSWLADLYTEGKTPDQMPISKFIMDDLNLKVIDDIDDLSQDGVYNAATAAGSYGTSLNGITQQVTNALANAVHPAFKIPLTAITAVNILDQVKKFEKGLPKKTRKKVKRIFMSDTMLLTYIDAYQQAYGTHVSFKDGDTIKTPLMKIEIVGLNNIPDTLIFATVNDNMVRLIDVIDKPSVTDIQVQDYTVKIFMEFSLGYDFLINELLYVAVFDGSNRGLNKNDLNALYYDSENLIAAA